MADDSTFVNPQSTVSLRRTSQAWKVKKDLLRWRSSLVAVSVVAVGHPVGMWPQNTLYTEGTKQTKEERQDRFKFFHSDFNCPEVLLFNLFNYPWDCTIKPVLAYIYFIVTVSSPSIFSNC